MTFTSEAIYHGGRIKIWKIWKSLVLGLGIFISEVFLHSLKQCWVDSKEGSLERCCAVGRKPGKLQIGHRLATCREAFALSFWLPGMLHSLNGSSAKIKENCNTWCWWGCGDEKLLYWLRMQTDVIFLENNLATCF